MQLSHLWVGKGGLPRSLASLKFTLATARGMFR